MSLHSCVSQTLHLLFLCCNWQDLIAMTNLSEGKAVQKTLCDVPADIWFTGTPSSPSTLRGRVIGLVEWPWPHCPMELFPQAKTSLSCVNAKTWESPIATSIILTAARSSTNCGNRDVVSPAEMPKHAPKPHVYNCNENHAKSVNFIQVHIVIFCYGAMQSNRRVPLQQNVLLVTSYNVISQKTTVCSFTAMNSRISYYLHFINKFYNTTAMFHSFVLYIFHFTRFSP